MLGSYAQSSSQAGTPQAGENGRLEASPDLGGHKTLSNVSNASLEAASLKCLCGGKFSASVL